MSGRVEQKGMWHREVETLVWVTARHTELVANFGL